jgi:hypothetical protein
MREDLAANVARVVAALLEDKAWFRHGVSDNRLCELTGLPMHRLLLARREAEAQGLVKRRDVGTEHAVTMLTPAGVARAQRVHPSVEDYEYD